jgi:hypothetical protein
MPKSRLTTEEIKALCQRGRTIEQIAQAAGISKPAVRYRLNREPVRQTTAAWQAERHDSVLVNNLRVLKEKQEISQKTAAIRGSWAPHEIKFMESHAQSMSILQVAQALQRTFYAVTSAAQRYGVRFRVE